jgi:hypothetical protein
MFAELPEKVFGFAQAKKEAANRTEAADGRFHADAISTVTYPRVIKRVGTSPP